MPTLQGKAVFLMPIRKADAPNQCSSSNKAVYKPFIVLLHLHCPSGALLRFAVCHTACSSYGIRHGSSCVLHATSFISSFVPLHYTTFEARPFATRLGSLTEHTKQDYKAAQILSQATLQYSLGSIPLHYVLHSFRSHSVHPLPIILLALRTTVCVTGLH
jgi:hypothetical protein